MEKIYTEFVFYNHPDSRYRGTAEILFGSEKAEKVSSLISQG